jgi:hypothetical protein
MRGWELANGFPAALQTRRSDARPMATRGAMTTRCGVTLDASVHLRFRSLWCESGRHCLSPGARGSAYSLEGAAALRGQYDRVECRYPADRRMLGPSTSTRTARPVRGRWSALVGMLPLGAEDEDESRESGRRVRDSKDQLLQRAHLLSLESGAAGFNLHGPILRSVGSARTPLEPSSERRLCHCREHRRADHPANVSKSRRPGARIPARVAYERRGAELSGVAYVERLFPSSAHRLQGVGTMPIQQRTTRPRGGRRLRCF